MQWLLQEFEDTRKLAEALDQLGYAYTWHKIIPFTDEITPEPVIDDPDRVLLFGAYSLWRYAQIKVLKPGVFKIRPFVNEVAWHPQMLNGVDALFLELREIPSQLPDDGRDWFFRPVEDSKEVPGRVETATAIHSIANSVLALSEDEIPGGSLRHDTRMMLTRPVRILKEWRVWVVNNKLVTFSLYKEGKRVIYRREIDEDALEFAQSLVEANPGYAAAYVMDVCRTGDGLKLLETNCINAAGFYSADLLKLTSELQGLCDE